MTQPTLTRAWYQEYAGVVVDAFDATVRLSLSLSIGSDSLKDDEMFRDDIVRLVNSYMANGFSTFFLTTAASIIEHKPVLQRMLYFAQKVDINIPFTVTDWMLTAFFTDLQSVYVDSSGFISEVHYQRFIIGEDSQEVFIKTPLLLPLVMVCLNFERTELFRTLQSLTLQASTSQPRKQ